LTSSLGDLAESAIKKLIADTSAPVEEATSITEEAALNDNLLSSKIRFSWRPEDRVILDRIRIAAEAECQEAFADMLGVLDNFYMQLRIPEQREGIVVMGADGRPVWKRNEKGQILESWNQLTGQDVEYALANLARLRMSVASQVNQLFLEAVFARHAASDLYDDAWFSRLEGTQGDRTAWSNRESRQDRYHAFFRFYLYSTAKVFLDELNTFDKLLVNVRYWQVRTQKG
jgi:hypothetical protein